MPQPDEQPAKEAAAAAAPDSKKQEGGGEEDSKEDCPWCRYMKGGGCREPFEVWGGRAGGRF